MTLAKRFLIILAFLVLVLIYTCIVYTSTLGHPLDFSTFYIACQALATGINPYQDLIPSFLVDKAPLYPNFNPPSLIWLFLPLAWMPYHMALLIWTTLSLGLGIIGAYIAFKLSFSASFLKQHWQMLGLLFLACFPVWINICLGQVGLLLLFMVMMGYYLYSKPSDLGAGVLWGLVIAFKLFPGLILIYALIQKRYNVILIAVLTGAVITLIPLVLYGPTLYLQYIAMLNKYTGYGTNWNGSLFGFIFRIFGKTQSLNIHQVMVAKYHALGLFCIGFIWYVKRLIQMEKYPVTPHQGFCFTLAMMLLLNPLGWIYYFTLLTLPLAQTWNSVQTKSILRKFLWLLSFYCINQFTAYTFAQDMQSNLIYYSCSFYGLFLVTYLISTMKASVPFGTKQSKHVSPNSKRWLWFMMIAIFCILAIEIEDITMLYVRYLNLLQYILIK